MKRTKSIFYFFFILLLANNTIKAQNLDSLKAQVKSQESRINDLERQLATVRNDSSYLNFQKARQEEMDNQNTQVLQIPKSDMRPNDMSLTGSDLIADDFIGSWPMFGSAFRMKIGGYFKSDLIVDFNGTKDPTQFLMSTIPVEGTPEYENDAYINFLSKDTRFNIDVRRVTPGAIPLRLFIEADFWATGSQLRLRHAYVTAGNFIVGQTWTTLSFLESLPFMIDFASGDALFGGRTTQVRYTRKVSDHWKLAVGIENQGNMGIENPDGLSGNASLLLPLLAIRADYSWKTGVLLMGSSISQLRWDGTAGAANARALQFDAVVGGRQYIGKNNYFTWNISYGKGSGENIMAFAGTDANAVLNSDGKLETMPAFALVGGFVHKWNDKLESNLSYAYGWLDTPESRSPYALKEGGIGHVNLIYHPINKFSTGLEYMWGGERVANDAIGRAHRLQLMVKFEF